MQSYSAFSDTLVTEGRDEGPTSQDCPVEAEGEILSDKRGIM